jgi:hypothetical protein
MMPSGGSVGPMPVHARVHAKLVSAAARAFLEASAMEYLVAKVYVEGLTDRRSARVDSAPERRL